MPWQPDLLPADSQQSLADNETHRHIALGDRIVPYVLRRARRRTIGLSIDHRGLRIGAPTRASLREIEALILQHGDWVTAKLDEWRSRRRPDPLQIVDGLRLPLLGGLLEVRLGIGSNRAVWASTEHVLLLLRSPTDAPRVLDKALRERARALFIERVAYFAPLLGVPIPPLSISAAKTRWGSCSRQTGIRLNWRLIHFAPRVVDYVVAHELAHLREMNHSPRFWATVAQLCPDYRITRDELRRLAAHCPQW